MSDYLNQVKVYFRFSKEEVKGFVLLVLLFSIIFSFDKWGPKDGAFDFIYGLNNLIIAFFISFVSVFIHHSAQKLMAIYYKLNAEITIWWYGIIIAIMFILISNGEINVLAASALIVSPMVKHRFGQPRFGERFSHASMIALMGPLANIFLATIIKTLDVWFGFNLISGQGFWYDLFWFNWMMALYNFLPIPPLDGSKIFFASRLAYAFAFGCIVGYIFLFGVGIYSYIFAVIIGALFWLLFYIFFERKWA